MGRTKEVNASQEVHQSMVSARLGCNYLDYCHVVAQHPYLLMTPFRPQTAHASAIGISSLAAIFSLAQSLAQDCWSHICCHTAPHPQEPEASDAKVTVGIHCGWWTSIILLAFHDERKASHHIMSTWNSAFNLTQWSGFLAFIDMSIIRLRNIRPACTTLHAWDNFPIRDSSSRFLHAHLSL